MTMVQVSPQRLLLSGWLLTNVQVNITTAIYDTGHTLIYITLLLLFLFFFTLLFYSSGQAGCPPFPLSVTLPIHWNIKYSPASPGRSRVGPALYVFSLLGGASLILRWRMYSAVVRLSLHSVRGWFSLERNVYFLIRIVTDNKVRAC